MTINMHHLLALDTPSTYRQMLDYLLNEIDDLLWAEEDHDPRRAQRQEDLPLCLRYRGGHQEQGLCGLRAERIPHEICCLGEER